MKLTLNKRILIAKKRLDNLNKNFFTVQRIENQWLLNSIDESIEEIKKLVKPFTKE